MKNYKVRALKDFNDVEENKVHRSIGDIFECTKERFEYLNSKKAVELIEIIEEKKEEIVEDLSIDPYENFEIKEPIIEEKKKIKKKKK